MRIVLDTNVLVSAVIYGGRPQRLLHHALSGAIETVSSTRMMAEFEEILVGRFGISVDVARSLREVAEQNAAIVSPGRVPRVSRDRDDDYVLATALEGEAELIVTGDKDLLDLGSYKGIGITTVRDALELIGP